MRDRLSFRRFCGIPLDCETPDHSSIWRFRQTIDKLKLTDQLLADAEIVECGFFLLHALPEATTRAVRARLAEVCGGVAVPEIW